MNEALDIIKSQFEQQIRQSTELTKSLTELRTTQQQVGVTLKALNNQFTNGFRAEIKDHISDVSKEQIVVLNDISDKITPLTKPAFWIKLGTSALCGIGAIAGIILLIV